VAGRFPDELIEEVKRATDLVDLISSHVPLRRAGKSFKARCPFHEEKTPSFIVNPERQTYRCFGCGEGGNAFLFLMAFEKVTFPEAVRILADRAGIPIRFEHGTAEGVEDRTELLRALRFARDFFVRQLAGSAGEAARRYLAGRSILPPSIERFGLGFAPPSWDALLRAGRGAGFPLPVLERAGLVRPGRQGSHYDQFRNRVMFPIVDAQERVVGFGARALAGGDEPKYLNSPETPVFAKSRILYGLPQARQAIARDGFAAVGEGYTDVIAAHQEGVESVVATLGTALTRDHARLLRRFTERVVLIFDADDAGAKASRRGVETILEEDLEIRIARLPAGVDPCDLVLSRGADALREALGEASEFFEFCLEAACAEHGRSSVHGRTRIAERLLDLIAKVRNPVRQGLFLRRLSEELGVAEGFLRQGLEARRGEVAIRQPEGEGKGLPDASDSTLRAERDLLEAAAGSVRLRVVHRDRIAPSRLRHPVHRRLAEMLSARTAVGDTEEDLEGLLAEADDAEVSRLLAAFLNRPRTEEEYERLAQGAIDCFERQRRRSDLRVLAVERRSALERGDEASVDRLLERTWRTLREGDRARRDRVP